MSKQLTEDETMRRLEQYRPVATDEWDTAARSTALAAALDDDRARHVSYPAGRRRRRWPAVIGGIAAAVLAVVVIELLPARNEHTPSSGQSLSSAQSTRTPSASASPGSGPVARLAAAARHTTLGNPKAGQYWYQRIELYGVVTKGAPPDRIGSTTNWVAPDGDDWLATDQGRQHSCAFYKYVGTPTINHPTATYLHSLPTEPAALYRFLAEHVTGSSSKPHAMFVAISDALHNDEGLVQPNLRAAFIAVLGRIPHVSVKSGVAYGHMPPPSPSPSTVTTRCGSTRTPLRSSTKRAHRAIGSSTRYHRMSPTGGRARVATTEVR